MKSAILRRTFQFWGVIGFASCLPSGAEPLLQGWVHMPSGQAAAGAQVMVFDLTNFHRVAAATTEETGWFAGTI